MRQKIWGVLTIICLLISSGCGRTDEGLPDPQDESFGDNLSSLEGNLDAPDLNDVSTDSTDDSAKNTYTREEIIYQINQGIRAVTYDRENFNLINVDLTKLEISDPVRQYQYYDGMFHEGIEFYPVIYEGHIILTMTSPVDGKYGAEHGLADMLDETGVRNMAIIYDHDHAYLYDGNELILLHEMGNFGEGLDKLEDNCEYDLSCIQLTDTSITYELNYPWSPEMAPYETDMMGCVGGYFFIPIKGDIYRFGSADDQSWNYTTKDLVYECTEVGIVENTEHSIYSLAEYPDYNVLCDVCKDSDGNVLWSTLIEYKPITGVSQEELDRAMNTGYVIMENGSAVNGKDEWMSFYEKVISGENASVRTVRIYTLDRSRCSREYYEASKYDYPMVFYREISFDGTYFYTNPLHFDGNDYSISYQGGYDAPPSRWEYLMHYTGEPRSQTALFSEYDRYVLVNDDSVTWEELEWGMLSSQFGDMIPYTEVYCEYTWK